jgi:NADH-quinone oxidoreductase subunit N
VPAFLSVASKAAGFAGLLELMFLAFAPRADFWAPVFAVLSILTMSIGNLVALQQRQVVRLLAYSSVAQAGYMLLPFALATTGNPDINRQAFAAAELYILIYGVMTLGAFAVVVGMSRDAPQTLISEYSGLVRRAPTLAVAMTVFLVSLAGIPPTAGFWAKFAIAKAGITRGGIGVWLAVILFVNSVISLGYYLSIAREMILTRGEDERRAVVPRLVTGVAILAALAVFVGFIYPDWFARIPPAATLVGK